MVEDEILMEDEEMGDSIDPKELEALRKDLEQRCKEANIEIEKFEGLEEGETTLGIKMQSGRETRWVYLYDSDNIKRFLSIPFEKYVFLSGYDAICSYTNAEIEAILGIIGGYSPRLIYRKLFKNKIDSSDVDEEDIDIVISMGEGVGAPEITIRPPSNEIKALSSTSRRSSLSLRLTDVRVSNQEQALSILERISNSLFFQIDLLTGISLTLVRERRRPPLPRWRRKPKNIIDDLTYPKTEFDDAPISLYWYAKSANNMPLLQFLAFYQVIEFYFPTYYQAEARRKIKAILKDPTFRSDRDSDLGRILGAIKVTRSGSLGDERSQLRATLTECIAADDLRAFIDADKNRKAFLSSNTKGLTDHKIPIENPNADLRNDVSDRIYDIRCKIVHTKGDSGETDVELLLPFSKQAEQLYHDIELLQFLAQQVLISASSPLKI